MKGFIQTSKNIAMVPLDVDATTKSVKIAFASIGDIDLDGDVFAENAFTKSIMERGPKGSNQMWHLLDHIPRTTSALSKFSEVYVDKSINKLVGVSKYKNTFAWREVAWPIYESGDITEHSIGFITLQDEIKTGYRLIKEAVIMEGSAVLWGANPNTQTLEVAKNLGVYYSEDEPEIQIEKMIKALKSESFDEDAKSLFIIELKQLESKLNKLKQTTVAAEQAPQPEPAKQLNEGLILTYLSL